MKLLQQVLPKHPWKVNKQVNIYDIGDHSPKFTQQVSLEYQRWLAERFIIA